MVLAVSFALSGAVWCGAGGEIWSVWCGVVWCGVVWSGAGGELYSVWCGVVWCSVVWCGVV